MKLIIEIPDSYNLDGIRNGSIYGQLVLNAVKNGTPIPDNATNGEVMKAMFKPNRITRLNDEWWNAPYQKGGKE